MPPLITDKAIGDGRLKHGPSADPRKEMVAGGQNLWLGALYRALPHYIDDVTTDFGIDLYERMRLDPQAESCLILLKMAALGGGLDLVCVRDDGDEDYEQAKEITDFCQRNIEGLARPFVSETLFELLDGLAYGNRVAEQIYEVRQGGEDAGKLCLAMLKVKPIRSTAFVVDAYNNVIGLLGLIPGQGLSVLSGMLVGAPPTAPNLLPRRKFVVFTYRPKAGDPRGSSILRPAYNAWWLKQQLWPEYLKYLTQFGGPSLIGTTPEKTQNYPLLNADGSIQTDTNGDPVYVEPEEAMLAALQEFRNGTAAAFPFGSTVTPLEMQGNGEAFLSAIELFDKQMAKAILCQTLATEQAQHQARAASQTHQDILALVVQHIKTCVEQMIVADILRPLVEYNFGPEAVALTPTASLGDTAEEDFAGQATAIAALETSGYLDPTQYAGLDARLGLPKRAPESIQQAIERKNAAPMDGSTPPDQGGQTDTQGTPPKPKP
jgi:hypothetical protein